MPPPPPQPSLSSFLLPLCVSVVGLGGFAALVRLRVRRPAGMTKVSTSEDQGSDEEQDAGLEAEGTSEREEEDDERVAKRNQPTRGSYANLRSVTAMDD